jgi:hypothetical protein
MAIKVAGTTVIDDSRNACNLGTVCATTYFGCGANLTGVGAITGAISYFPAATAPSGYLPATGGTFTKTDYCGLYNCYCGKVFTEQFTSVGTGTVYNFGAALTAHNVLTSFRFTGRCNPTSCPLCIPGANCFSVINATPEMCNPACFICHECNCTGTDNVYFWTPHMDYNGGIIRSMTNQGVMWLGQWGACTCVNRGQSGTYVFLRTPLDETNPSTCPFDGNKVQCYWAAICCFRIGCPDCNTSSGSMNRGQYSAWAKCNLMMVVMASHASAPSYLSTVLINTCCHNNGACLMCAFCGCGRLHYEYNRDMGNSGCQSCGATYVKFNWICGLCGCSCNVVGFVVTNSSSSFACRGFVGKIYPCGNSGTACCGGLSCPPIDVFNTGSGTGCGVAMSCFVGTTGFSGQSTVKVNCYQYYPDELMTYNGVNFFPSGCWNCGLGFHTCRTAYYSQFNNGNGNNFDVGNDRAVLMGDGGCFGVACFTTTNVVINCYCRCSCACGSTVPIHVTYSNALDCWFMSDESSNIWTSPGNCGTNWTLALCGSTCICGPVTGIHDLDNKAAVFTGQGAIFFTCGSGTWVCRCLRNRQIFNDRSPRLVKMGNYYIGFGTAYTCDLCCTGFTNAPSIIHYSKSCGFIFSLSGGYHTMQCYGPGGALGCCFDASIQHALFVNRNETENIYWKECVLHEVCGCSCRNAQPKLVSYNCDLDKIYSFAYYCGSSSHSICFKSLCLTNGCGNSGLLAQFSGGSTLYDASVSMGAIQAVAAPYGSYEGFIAIGRCWVCNFNVAGSGNQMAITYGCISGNTATRLGTCGYHSGSTCCNTNFVDSPSVCFQVTPYHIFLLQTGYSADDSGSCCDSVWFIGFSGQGVPTFYGHQRACVNFICAPAGTTPNYGTFMGWPRATPTCICLSDCGLTNGNFITLSGTLPETYFLNGITNNTYGAWTSLSTSSNRPTYYTPTGSELFVSCGTAGTTCGIYSFTPAFSQNYVSTNTTVPFGMIPYACIFCCSSSPTQYTGVSWQGSRSQCNLLMVQCPFQMCNAMKMGSLRYVNGQFYTPWGRTSPTFDTSTSFQVPLLPSGYFVKT